MTDSGFQCIDLVKQIVIDYLEMLSESSYNDMVKLYCEYRKTKEMEFHNYIIPDASNFATNTTSFWVTHNNVNPQYLISYPYTFGNYSLHIHETCSHILSLMSYQKVIVFERSKLFDQIEMSEEKWYKVKYMKSDINYESKNIVNDINLRLPYENEYVCDNGVIVDGTNNSDIPTLLPLENISLWWKYDTIHGTPDINLVFNMGLPSKFKTKKDRIISKLYFKCLDHVINAELYNINCANYQASITRHTSGFSVQISGYPEKFINVLQFIVESLRNLKDNLTEDLFNNIKKLYQQELENYIYTPPYKMITYSLSTKIANDVYTIKDTLYELDSVNYDDLMQFDLMDTSGVLKINDNTKKRLIKEKSYNSLYGLIQGNIQQDEAMKIGLYLNHLNELNLQELTEQIKETDEYEFTEILENKDEANSCYKLSLKIGYLRPDLDEHYIEKLSCLQILNEIISEEYFDQLRTKEQLGYVVFSHISNYGNNHEQPYSTYDFCVQSSVKDAEYLKERTIKFIAEFREFLINESEESINNIINSAILQLETPFQNLKKAVAYNFATITNYCSNFNFKHDKKEFMKTLNKEILINFYDRYFSLNRDTYWSIMLKSDK